MTIKKERYSQSHSQTRG